MLFHNTPWDAFHFDLFIGKRFPFRQNATLDFSLCFFSTSNSKKLNGICFEMVCIRIVWKSRHLHSMQWHVVTISFLLQFNRKIGCKKVTVNSIALYWTLDTQLFDENNETQIEFSQNYMRMMGTQYSTIVIDHKCVEE